MVTLGGLYFIFRVDESSNAEPRTQQLKPDGDKQSMSVKVTVDEVARVAELAHLELTPEESGHMLHDLNAILDYIAELNELDTRGVVPLAQVSELFSAAGDGELRADLLRPSLDRATVLTEAPETDGVFFKVPKVIERQ
jgi:aspartyl-tRNA(Asn)/glutamyl-tRNA(Gln) amidotransferase subunit C